MFPRWWGRRSDSETTDSSGQKRLELIAEKVFHKVGGLPKYPLDLERRALVLKERLIGGGILGICGVGGIGKTSLAMQVFNMISKDFEYTCFVNNVKGVPLLQLQNRVLHQFHYNGKKLVCNSTRWDALRNKKALIAMDDVDGEDQLRELPNLEHFGTGSCIIVTSRKREVFKYFDRCIVHEVDPLQDHDAKRLICQHAFGSGDVPDFLSDKVDAVVSKCHGLPLVLEVIGTYLQDHATDRKVWIKTFHKLTEAQVIIGERNDRVWPFLKISYDTLLPKAQEMFTEAALFFFERPLDEALAAWSTLTQTMQTTWNKLVSMSLVKEINNRVWVHEHLRDLALEISKDIMVSGTDETANSAVDLLNDKQVETTTKCLRLRYNYRYNPTRRTLKLASLAKLKGLKFVDLEKVPLEGSGNNFSTKISLLKLRASEVSKFEFSLNKMHKLSVLELSNFQIPDEFPDALGNLTNLRTLRLSELQGLVHLPENFAKLSRLRQLDVSCLSTLTLPKSFGKLRALKHLQLSRIRSLTLPESLGDLSNLTSDGWTGLQDLYISSVELKTLPASLYGLKSLQQLTIDCPKLEMLSESLGELELLERLDLCVDSVRTLPFSVGHLSLLRHLRFKSSNIELLPESLGKLSLLKAFTLECHQLKKLPNTFGQLGSLQELSLAVPLLEQLPESFGELHHLRELEILHADELQTLPDSFSGLRSLQMLSLDCSKLERLPDQFGNICALEESSMRSSSLESLPQSALQLQSLKKLTLRARRNATSLLGGVVQISPLQKVEFHLHGHDETVDLFEPLRHFRHDLTLRGHALVLPASLGALSSLRALHLEGLLHLRSLPDELGTLSFLERLTIVTCARLQSLPESLGQVSSLKVVLLERCFTLKTLPERWGTWSGMEGADPARDGGEELIGVPVQGGESSHTKRRREPMRLLVETCPLLNAATMEGLGWICVATFRWYGQEYRRKVMD